MDSIPLSKAHWTDEGYLVDNPIVTSCGVFEYHNKDGSTRYELRLPEHVFNKDSLSTYEGKPVIVTHEAGEIDKNNVADEIIGTILSPGYQDGDDVRAKIIIHDTNEVKKSGLRELSLGYELMLDETPGTWNGQHYDAIQTEIAVNHLALVRSARAGEQARLNIDGKNQLRKEERGMAKPKNTGKKSMNADQMQKTISAYEARRKARLDEEETELEIMTEPEVDTEPTSTDSTVEDRIKAVNDRRDRRDSDGDPEDEDALKLVIAQQDEDISELLEIIELLEAKSDFAEAEDEDSKCDEDEFEEESGGGEIVIKLDSVDKIVRERLQLGRIGDRLNMDGLETMKPLSAKKSVIKKLKPTMNLDGKSATYINAAFDMAVAGLDTGDKWKWIVKEIIALIAAATVGVLMAQLF